MISLNRMRRFAFHVLKPHVMVLSLFVFAGIGNAQEGKDSREKILADQQRVLEQYELLEQKLFSLYQYEQEQNPDRAELLQQAYQSSREKLTLQKLSDSISQLQQSRLRNAERNQGQAALEIQALLELLQSEDRNKRVHDQIERYKEYVKEINRILRLQQGIRGQSERQPPDQKQREEQEQISRRTGDLNRKIEENEQGNSQSNADPDSADPNEKPNGQPNGQQEPSAEENSPSSETSKPSGQSGAQENPVQQRLQNAEQRMREARAKLDEAKKEDSIEKMRQAEKELQQAKAELEKILRQLREEEIKRTLDSLESRFRKMLEAQIRIMEDTVALDAARDSTPVDAIEIQSSKLSGREKSLLVVASRTLLILEDDGSSVAVTESLVQIQEDMQQVADRLSAAKTGATSQAIQQGIIDSLGFLVSVFDKARSDLEKQEGQPGQQGGQPGEKPLIDQLAELKLIRGMQNQILNRHARYSKLLENPNDQIGHSNDPGIQRALEQLGERQYKLRQITYDIAIGKNE